MGIDVSLALREAAGRMATVPGAIVALLFVVAGVVELVVVQTITTRAFEYVAEEFALPMQVQDQIRNEYGTGIAFDLGIGLEQAIAVFLLVFLLVIAFRVAGVRVFAAAQSTGFPSAAVKYRFFVAFLFVLLFEALLIATTIALLVGPAVLVGALTDPTGPGASSGLLLFALYAIVLGIFIALPLFLYFARQEMVLNDRNTIAAIGASYRTAKANLGSVFVLLALIFVLNVVGGLLIDNFLSGIDLAPLVSTTYQRLVAVFGIAASTRAYMQVT